MEPKYSEERPIVSTRLGSGSRVSSGGTKRVSEFPIVSSSTSSSDEETTTTDYYSYEASALSPGAESVATNASDTSLSLKVDEFTNYRLPGSERSSTSAHSQRSSAQSQRSSASSVSSRYRKKRVTDSGSVAGTSEGSRSYALSNSNSNNNNSSDDGEELQSARVKERHVSDNVRSTLTHSPTNFSAEQRTRRTSEKQLKNDSSFLDVSTGVPLPVTVSSSIPVMNTVTISSSYGGQNTMAPTHSHAHAAENSPQTGRSRLNSLDVQTQTALAKTAAPTRLLRGRQKLADLKTSEAVLPPGALRLRPLPKSFFQQPNRPSPIPPGISAFPLLPPLGDEQLNGSADESPKPQRRSTIYVGNVELLHRLFDRVECKERKGKPLGSPNATLTNASPNCTNGATSYQMKMRSNSLPRAPAACSKLLNSDPFLLENLTDRLFPELCLDQHDSLNSSLNGSKAITLPSLGGSAEVNYPQMLSELVTQI